MNEKLQFWLERAEAVPGVLACGARCPDLSVVAKSCDDQFPPPQVEKLVRELADTIRSLQINKIAAERLRWTFENAWLYCIAGADGTAAVLVVTKQIETSPEVEELLAAF
jgi:hypothetical protein